MRLRKRHAWGAVLIALFALPVLRPAGIESIEEPAGGFFAWFAELAPSTSVTRPAPELEAEDPRVRALEQENRRVWEDLLRTRQRIKDHEALEAALARSELDRLPPVVLARVTRGHDPSPRRRSILIDRGTTDGVRVGHPVVMGRAYVGRVRVARSNSSLVQLVTDSRTRLEVLVRTSKGQLLRGYARRNGSEDGIDVMGVEFVRLHEGTGTIRRGAPVYTSNFDERVPAHLLLGTVFAVSDPDLDRMPTLTVRPALDMERSTEVMVLLTTAAGTRTAGRSR